MVKKWPILSNRLHFRDLQFCISYKKNIVFWCGKIKTTKKFNFSISPYPITIFFFKKKKTNPLYIDDYNYIQTIILNPETRFKKIIMSKLILIKWNHQNIPPYFIDPNFFFFREFNDDEMYLSFQFIEYVIPWLHSCF